MGSALCRKLVPILVFAVIAPAAAAGKPHYTVEGKVVRIADGDTLTVLDSANVLRKIRLAGIDAPEKKQPFGTEAREALADKVFGQVVRVEVIDVDRYRREVGRIYLGGPLRQHGDGPRGLCVALRAV
jgi:endonuclease YncB( thermonuclease family)